MTISKFASLLTLAAMIGGANAALAQQAPPPQPGVDAQSTAQVSDEMVDKFADAYASIQSIQEEYTQKLQEAQDREKAQELQQEAQGEMLSAVEDHDLSVQEYNEMIARMDQDPELRQRVFSKVMDE